jgi:large subunit ribosomal protein L4
MELAIRSDAGGTLEVSDAVFGADYKPALIHQVVTAYMAAARAGTQAQKNRAAVSGGGSKPWRQKGTGRARAGTTRSPLWRGGGRAFAAAPRSYDQKVNRKMYRGAVCSILSELARQERLVVVPDITVTAPKTKELAAQLQALGVSDALVVTEAVQQPLELAARNLREVDVTTAQQIDPVSLIAFEHVVITEAALQRLEERLT